MRVTVVVLLLAVLAGACTADSAESPAPVATTSPAASPTPDPTPVTWSSGGVSWDGTTLDLGPLAIDELALGGSSDDPEENLPVELADGRVSVDQVIPALPYVHGGIDLPTLVVSLPSFVQESFVPGYVWTPDGVWVLLPAELFGRQVDVALGDLPLDMNGGIGHEIGDFAWLSLSVTDTRAFTGSSTVVWAGIGRSPGAAMVVPDPHAEYPTAGDLADVLVRAEELLHFGELEPSQHAQWSWVQQAAYRQLVDRPEWDEQVRAAVPPELLTTFDANLLAGRELRVLTTPRDELPWEIIEPPSVEVLLDAYDTAADEFGIDWSYLAAIHLVETRMGRIRGDSHAGAQGPMQFIPSTWEAYGEGDVNDPHDAIRAAARYLADHGAPGNMDGALWAYNHSDRYVAAVQAYASVMRADRNQYRTYHGWQVYYRLTTGDEVLEVGWRNDAV